MMDKKHHPRANRNASTTLVLGVIFAMLLAFLPRTTVQAANTDLSIEVMSPSENEVLQEGQPYRITWNSTNIDTIAVYLVLPTGAVVPVTPGSEINNKGFYDWIVDMAHYNTNTFKFNMIGWKTGIGNIFYTSKPFTIAAKPSPIVINQPAPGTTWTATGLQSLTTSWSGVKMDSKLTFQIIPASEKDATSPKGAYSENITSKPQTNGTDSLYWQPSANFISGDYILRLICTANCGPNSTQSNDVPISIINPPTVSAPKVDIKVNGSDGPVTVMDNKFFTVDWSSSGATLCSSTNQNYLGLTKYDTWKPAGLMPSGTQLIEPIPLSNSGTNTASATFTIGARCYNSVNLNFGEDTVTVTIASSGNTQKQDANIEKPQNNSQQNNSQASTKNQTVNQNQSIKKIEKSEIVNIQKYLKKQKIYHGPSHGKITKVLQRAIKKFQKLNKLKTSGNLDTETRKALNNLATQQ